MSIAIQKKKFLSNQYSNPSHKVKQFLLTDPFHEKYLKTLSDFEANFRKNYGQATLRGLKETLESFYNGLKVNELFISDLSKHGEALNNNIDDVVLVKKTSDIVNMLADYIVDRRSLIFRKRNSLDLLKNIFSESRDVTLLCLKVLKLFSMINVHFAFVLSNKEKFVAKIFELMLQDNKVYFKQVLGIQEAMIAAHPEVIDASVYPYIRDILLNIPRKYFARFSRVIALLVLENSEKIEFKELSPCYSDNKIIKVHSLLLSIPDIVEAYTVILESIIEITERLIATTPETLHKTIRYLKESTLIKDSGINLSFLKPIFEQANVSEAIIKDLLSPKFMAKFMVKKSNVTEILFIISNLLSSKRKIEVQNKLRHINFVDRVITPMFDLLFHPDIDTDNSDDSNGNDNEEYCGNPLTTARIQLLRIIINFCDRDSANIANKELLLSSEEKAILNLQIIPNTQNLGRQQQNELASTFFFNTETLTKNAFESVQKKGLINKIIKLIQHFPPNSSFCFWLASCVESFLRGFHEPHQIFVAHSGLMHRLMENVLNKKMTKSTNIQISYDLIGEILKFSRYNLAFFDALCETLNWTDLLFEHTSASIVDANVFLRGLILSFEKLDYVSKTENGMEVENTNQSSKTRERFLSDKISLFHKLIAAVDPAAVNQDNICCINTALIIAMFADQKGLLGTYVNTLDSGDEKKGLSTRKLIENFCGVLDIWNKYYTAKTKDCFSLQYTSSIPFYAFQLTQERLQNLFKQRLI